ncbi:carboxyl-terminal processing protease [Geothermobacter ehrlichii]|uniref:Carboxyl-terminal processing protease n=1 Tax=Geothermobacter ehrlichii TaxID=213224 RepID=A0A5D3WMH7_9BACT|nr:S41 family peptidase [Geothermobacter ehrlichii]TYO98746.1 carboxyl-terminal processing protease [Geothermobacter ehrlichii]
MRGVFRHLILTGILLVAAAGMAQAAAPDKAAGDEKSAYEELRLFTDVLTIVRKSYVEQVDLSQLVHGAIEGMLATLDPHSGYMPPEMFEEMQIDTTGEFGGLGIEITMEDGVLTIVTPLEDTPASRAGLQPGDQIVRIEEKSTKNMNLMEAVRLMRGPAGTEISLAIAREGEERLLEVSLVREIIKIHSVKARLLDDGIGYVRIAQFQERTADDLRRALDDLVAETGGELDGLVLDLRNNPGGLLEQAVKVADAFLKEGLIVYTEGRDEESQMSFSAEADGTEPDCPLVVLINSGSASASEIVAGALRDHRRALILGTRSFGKGSVQTIIPLEDGSGLRLTTARYFTPNGTSIQARGIRPDIEVHSLKTTEEIGGEHLREADLENHFDAPEEGPSRPASSRLSDEDRADYQLMRALDLLRGMQVFRSLSRPAA